jgi:alpha-L-rhamnosidase
MRYGYDMKTAARTTLNALAVDDFRRVAAMARALGKPATESARETTRAEAVTAAMRKRLERPDGVFVDGLRSDGTRSAHASQQANAYALAFGVAPTAREEAVADTLVALKNAMGVVNFRVLLDALHAAGRDDALVAALTDPNRPGYARILAEGATFTWESWDARQTGDSESHGWGSTVLAVLQDDVLGARITAPGAAHIEVAVPKTTLTEATGVVTTQRGPVPIAWTRDATGHETVEVTIPTNVSATVHLAASDVASVRESGRGVVGDPGVTDARAVNHEVVMTVGSGHYVFASSKQNAPGSSSSTAGIVIILAAIAVAAVAGGIAIGMTRRRHAR